jgi:hypothetical protein
MDNMNLKIENKYYSWDVQAIPDIQTINLTRTYRTTYDDPEEPITENTSNEVALSYNDVRLSCYFKNSQQLTEIINALLETQTNHFPPSETDHEDFDIPFPELKKQKEMSILDNVEEDYISFDE